MSTEKSLIDKLISYVGDTDIDYIWLMCYIHGLSQAAKVMTPEWEILTDWSMIASREGSPFIEDHCPCLVELD